MRVGWEPLDSGGHFLGHAGVGEGELMGGDGDGDGALTNSDENLGKNA